MVGVRLNRNLTGKIELRIAITLTSNSGDVFAVLALKSLNAMVVCVSDHNVMVGGVIGYAVRSVELSIAFTVRAKHKKRILGDDVLRVCAQWWGRKEEREKEE